MVRVSIRVDTLTVEYKGFFADALYTFNFLSLFFFYFQSFLDWFVLCVWYDIENKIRCSC